MLTTLDSSPTSTCSSITAVFTQPSSCSSPDTTEQQREPPSSPPKQDSSCAKRPSSRTKHSNRHMPYPDHSSCSARSPGSCSSDGGDSVQSDGDTNQEASQAGPCKVKRVAANSRERKRMHTVNSAFDQLRELVPTYPSNRKLSKIDTLRLACTYIQDLVSLLHNTQGIQGDDVLYHQPFPDTFNGYPVAVKQEIPAEFPPFNATHEHLRMQPACVRFPGPQDGCPEPYPTNASETDTSVHSPPHPFMQQAPPPPAVSLNSRPPPLTRVSSEGTASIHTRMAEASISGSAAVNVAGTPTTALNNILPPPPPLPPTSMYQRQVNITSPLAMHSVHHHSSTNILQNSLGHHSPPPVWQRATPVPNGFALYGQ